MTIVLCATLITSWNAFSVQDCAELENNGPEECLKYLAQPRASVKDNCVSYAVHRIGDKRYAPATEVLIQYLDYKIRDLSHEQNFRVKLGLGRSDPYPAIDALFAIGRPSVIPLVNRLATEDMDSVVRDNAVLILLFIYSPNMGEAVSILVKASHEATDSVKAENLMRAARLASDKCPDQLKASCLKALR